MNKPIFKRSTSWLLALVLTLCTAPLDAKAFTLIQLKDTDVTLEETDFTYTGQEIRPNVTVRVGETLLTLDKDYTLSYRNNIKAGTGTVIVTGISDASDTVGYTGTVEVEFTISSPVPVTLKEGHVTMEGREFSYTGSYITPKVTVTVGGQVLTPGIHYTLTYHNNLGAGTATASVSGIEEGGYTGQVNLSFTIKPDEGPGYVEIPLTEKYVALESTSFPYTGSAVEPKVTVTLEGKALTLGRDYSVSYENNVEPGTATAIVRGLANASENLGYSGEVRVHFTILPEEAPETKPDETPETNPGESVPGENPGGSVVPGAAEYKITKGDKATWYRNSAKVLSFTADGGFEDFKGVEIDGKALDSKYYTAKSGSTVITLKSAFLQKLGTGKHTITILFEDGQAEGAFQVSAALDSTNPETSDNFQMGLWVSLMVLSLAGALGLMVLRKKNF